MKKISIVWMLFLLLQSNSSIAQTESHNQEMRDSLSKVSSVIWKQKTDSLRLVVNERFFKIFQSALESNGSIAMSFDSISGITRVSSDDDRFRVFTWNVPISDGSNKYFGFIQILGENNKVIPLKSVNYKGTNIENEIFTPSTWYGALYYKLIEEKSKENTLYTLLGWDGNNSESNRKFIDIISEDKSGSIAFGMPIFKTDRGIKSRVIFEYAKKSSMTLRYDYQAIRVKKKKKIKKEDTWLIVMDRLAPMDPSLKGMYKYYVPSGDIYDGFIFRNGYWILVEDVDVANKTNTSR
jgi:hypothetical protein